MTVEQIQSAQVGAFDQTNEQALRYLGLNPNNPADQAMVAVARHYDLDPLLKHVVVIPKGGVYITRDGYLHIAHRSGVLDGIVVDAPPRVNESTGEWEAVVTVWRKDMSHGFKFPGRYPAKGGNKDYAQEMALKAAESHALRRAFNVTGLPALDEQRPDQERRTGLAATNPQTGEGVPRMGNSGTPSPPDAAGPDEPPGWTTTDGPGEADAAPLPGEGASGDEDAAPGPLLDPNSALARRMFKAVRDAGVIKDNVHTLLSEVTGRTITSSKQLTEDEARRVIDFLPTTTEENQ